MLASVPQARRGALELVGLARVTLEVPIQAPAAASAAIRSEHLVDRELAVAAGADDRGDASTRCRGARRPRASPRRTAGCQAPAPSGCDRVAADVEVDDEVAAERVGGSADPLRGARRHRR